MWVNGIEAKLNLKEYWPVMLIVVADTMQRKLRYKLKGFEDFTGIKLVWFQVELSSFASKPPSDLQPLRHLHPSSSIVDEFTEEINSVFNQN